MRIFPLLSLFGLTAAFTLSAVACGSGDSSPAAPPDAGPETSSPPSEGQPEAGTAPDAPPPEAASDASPRDTTPNAYCTHLFGSMASLLDRCCAGDTSADATAGREYVNELLTDCESVLSPSIAKGRLVPTANQGACFDALDAKVKNASCTTYKEALAEPLERSPLAATCATAYEGVGDVGAPCAIPDECKPGLACVGYVAPTSKSAGIDGKCGAPAAASQPCGAGFGPSGIAFNLTPLFGQHPGCQPGSRCAGTCTPKQAEGQDCFVDDECIEGTRCLLDVCSKGDHVDAGGACKETNDCVYPFDCVRGGEETGTCGALRAAGEGCTSSKECEGLCYGPDGGAKACVSFCGSK